MLKDVEKPLYVDHLSIQGLLLTQAAPAQEDSWLQDGKPAQVHWKEDNG